MSENGSQEIEPIPQEDIASRIRRTHISEQVTAFLSSLDLPAKLDFNKEVEGANKRRNLKTANFHLDPDNTSRPGSPAASMISLDADEWDDLTDRAMFERFHDRMPDSTALAVSARLNAAEAEGGSSGKRKVDADSDDIRGKKRRVMDGDKAVERVEGEQRPIVFTEIMYLTEDHAAIPLPLFLNRALQYIIDEAATVETTRSNPLPGQTKGPMILDTKKILPKFGEEKTLTYGEWCEAAANMYRFQCLRDKNGPSGSFAGWYKSHFGFFTNQADKLETYDAWKELELKIRRDYRSAPTKFDISYYASRYMQAKSEFRMRQELKEALKVQNPAQQTQGRPLGGGSFRGTSRNPNTSSFKPREPFRAKGNGSLPSCLLCAAKGHSVASHYGSFPQPTKFADDNKTLWGKIGNRCILSPDGKELCITYNVTGDRNGVCDHLKDGRAHLCSWCGSKSHHALSWTCRSQSG